ncbi:hypothetical protein [Brevibacillus sp. SYP-B805]|uniref:hypothetical protein n=1 Tax=Brevibacillus sp. SYP-B805 TaxID=1578199 RepID=UPI001F498FA7|nr:hypothetical protein [Brevibacillus sp. SYP-B805]
MTAIISVIAALSGIILGWTGRSRTIRQDIAQQASADAIQRVDIDYIKRGIDDIRVEQKNQVKRIDELAERVTRVEESAKQAHKRIDRLDGDG